MSVNRVSCAGLDQGEWPPPPPYEPWSPDNEPPPEPPPEEPEHEPPDHD